MLLTVLGCVEPRADGTVDSAAGTAVDTAAEPVDDASGDTSDDTSDDTSVDTSADTSTDTSIDIGGEDTSGPADTSPPDADADGTPDAEDCAPDDPSAHPGAAEICGTAIDEDCDGTENACGLPASGSITGADVVVGGRSAGDFAGYTFWIGDLDGDGQDDLVSGAFTDDLAGSASGAVYVEPGPIVSSFNLGSSAASLSGGAPSDHAGRSVWGADFDEDGVGDLIVGITGESTAAATAGGAALALGPFAGTHDLGAADATWLGEDEGDESGWVVHGGDFDGNGTIDALVSSRTDDEGGFNAGCVHVVTDVLTGGSLRDADAKLLGENAEDDLGWGAMGIDMDGDAVSDVLVGAEDEDEGGDGAGAGYLVLGPLSGTVDLAAADAKFVGEDANDDCGRVFWGGDVDADGTPDLYLSCTRRDAYGYETGAAYLLYGPHSGTVDLSTADAVLLGESTEDWAGRAATAADLTGDGETDFVVGGEQNDSAGTDAGVAWVVAGPISGVIELAAADYRWTGAKAGDKFGWTSKSGDLDGDGWPDLVVGAHEADVAATDDGGGWVVFGGPGL